MSKHIGRKEQWVEMSPTRHQGFFGYVSCNKNGMWDAITTYQVRQPLVKDPRVQLERRWCFVKEYVGEYKRAREAKMAVEAKVRELKARNSPDIII